MYGFVSLLAVIMPILELTFKIIAIYALVLAVKALQIYIKNNN